MNLTSNTIQFELPDRLACPKPTERRGIERDEVRLLVSDNSGKIEHKQFYQLHEFLQQGDVLVVNTSATRASALDLALPGARQGRLHFSTRLSRSEWLVEIREVKNYKTMRWNEGVKGQTFNLADGARLELKEKFYGDRPLLNLWKAKFYTSQTNLQYLETYAEPIQYEKLDHKHPLSYYQTYFSFSPGSSEMPSAGRAFTQDLVEKLIAKGVEFAPILLHTGVSSLEENEKPYSEYMEINPISSAIINKAKKEGRRVIAVGTTAVRAVESIMGAKGELAPFKGYTELYIDEEYEMKVVDGLLTGFHEPRASHLNMLQALAGHDHLQQVYNEAIALEYYWHQFGDLHLILP